MKKIISFIGIIALIFVVYFLTRFSLFYVSDVNGYYFAGDEIYDLINSTDTELNSFVETERIKLYQNLYVRNNDVYIGDTYKKKMDLLYPIFSSDGSQVVNLSNKSTLINDNFDNEEAYKGIILTGGFAYNQGDPKPKSNHGYFFLKLENGLMVNLYDIAYDYGVQKGTIPTNSIVLFTENYINYFENQDGNFVFKSIKLISDETIININKNHMTYYNFLESLNILTVVIPEIESSGEYYEGFTDVVAPPEDIVDPYIPPVVEFDKFTPNVYTASGIMTLIDDGGVIKRSPTFTFYLEDNIFLSRQVTMNGQFTVFGLEPGKKYKVVGDFTYYTEEGKLVEATFYKGEVTTLGFDTLTPVNLSIENNEHYPNKVVLDKISVAGSLENEVLNGVSTAFIEINNNQYPISKNELNKLVEGKAISVSTPNSLESDSHYEYKLVFYDKFNNILPFNNTSNTSYTIKQTPDLSLTYGSDFTDVDINFSLNNKDNVSIDNFYYELYDINDVLIESDELNINGTLNIDNLDSDAIYYIYIYADYDLGDGKGVQEKQLLKNDTVTTINLEDLGPLRVLYNYNKAEVMSDSFKLDVSVNYSANPSTELMMSFLDRLEVRIYDKDEKYNKTFKIKGKNLQNAVSNIIIKNLASSTQYNIETKAFLKFGDRSYEIAVMHNLDFFKTIKADPVFVLTNSFESSNFISFDVKVVDLNEAIANNRIVMSVFDSANKLIDYQFIDTNKGLKTLTFDKLKPNSSYRFLFVAEGVNLQDGNGSNRKIFKYVDSNNEESDYYTFTTTDKLSGKLQLNSLLKDIKSVNKFNIADKNKWLSSGSGIDLRDYDLDADILTLGLKANGSRNYSYYVPELKNQHVQLYFKVRSKSISSMSNTFLLRVGNAKSPSSFLSLYKKDANTATPYNSVNKSMLESNGGMLNLYTNPFTVSSDGYITFNLKDTDNSVTNFVEIIEFVIRPMAEGFAYDYVDQNNKNNNRYEEDPDYFVSNISYTFKDERAADPNRNPKTIKNLYLKICLEGQEDKDCIKVNDEINSSGNTLIDPTPLTNKLLRNSKYTVSLNIEVPISDGLSKHYTLDTITFTTEDEIRAINGIPDFKTVHNKGKYIVNSDLDFTQSMAYLQGLNTATFYGIIDFQGHSMDVKTLPPGSPYYKSPIYNLGRSSKILNVVVNVHLNNTGTVSTFTPFVSYNSGTISNIKVNLIKDVENVGILTYYAFICYTNYGIIENFAIDMSEDLKFNFQDAVVSRSNEGIIRNGYVLGNGTIDTQYPKEQLENKTIGVISGYTNGASLISNVFTNVNIDMYNNETDGFNYSWQVGSLVGTNNMGTINNSFSIGLGKNRYNYPEFVDINVGINTNRFSSDKLYYISNLNLDNSYSTNVSLSYLSNADFINSVINNEFNMFTVEENIELSHFPTLKWPDSMPNQTLHSFTPVNDATFVDFIEAEEIPESELSEGFYKNRQNKYNTKKLKLKVYNKNLDKITEVGIKGLNTIVYKDEQEDTKLGYSYVYIKASTYNEYDEINLNAEFKDNYYLTYISVLNSNQDKEYYDLNNDSSKERRVAVFSLYNEITTIQEWVKMNDKYDNYILLNDLDFSSCTKDSCYRINNFRGTLNGNGKTVKNITAVNSSGAITNLYGKIHNLKIDNYYQKVNSYYSGFVYQTNNGSLLDDIHLTNIRLTSGTYMGGLVGYLNYGTLTNSTIKGFELDNSKYSFSSSTVGGLVGNSNYSKITNCASYNFLYNREGNMFSGVVGGLVGSFTGGILSNSIVTGKIITSAKGAGGLVGNGNGTIYNNITYVDIFSERDYTGGIVGNVLGNTLVSIYSNLTFGDVFTTNTGSYIGRTVGYYRTSSERSINYAYNKQKINGIISSYSETESLLSEVNLSDSITYTEIIGFDSNYNYDKVKDGYLPQITYSYDNKKVIAPDIQVQFKKDYELVPQDINADLTEPENNGITVTVNFERDYFLNDDQTINVNNLINSFKIDGQTTDVSVINRNIEGFDDPDTFTNDNPNQCTLGDNSYRCDFTFAAENYYDNYNLASATLNDGTVVSLNLRIDESTYKVISTVNEWNEFFGQNKSMQNVKLSADIDFGGAKLTSISSLNRLLSDSETQRTLSNFTVEKSFVDLLMSEITHVNFKKVYVKAPNSGAKDYSGIIGRNYGDITFINFEDITVHGYSYVGMVGSNGSNNVNEISVKDVLLYGQNYVGGFSGYDSKADITNVTIDNASIFAGGTSSNSNTGTYVGGMIGYLASASGVTYSGFKVKNSNIVGCGYVGGMFGYIGVALNNGLVENVNVIGRRSYSSANSTTNMYSYRVGGVAGLAYGISYTTVKNVNVVNNGREMGSLLGYVSGGVTYNIVQDTNVVNYKNYQYVIGDTANGVEGKLPEFSTTKLFDSSKITHKLENISFKSFTTETNLKLKEMHLSDFLVKNSYTGDLNSYRSNVYIGGLAGVTYSSMQYNGIKNTNVYSEDGTYVGGLKGHSTALYYDTYNYLINVNVEGKNRVGGLIGNSTANINYQNQINVNVVGNDYVGGIIGYVDNKNATASLYYTLTRSSILMRSTVKGNTNNTGSVYGFSYYPMNLSNKLYRLIVDVDLTTPNPSVNSYILGNYRVGDENKTNSIFVYDKSKFITGGNTYIIGELPQNSTQFTHSLKITLADLKIGSNNYYTSSTTNRGIALDGAEWARLKNDTLSGGVVTIPGLKSTYYPHFYKTSRFRVLPDKIELPQEGAAVSSISQIEIAEGVTKEHVLPNYECYIADGNILNIDFSNVDSDSYFSVVSGDTVVDYIPITKKTYSFEYNYKNDIVVYISDGIKLKKDVIKREDLFNTSTVLENKYYYLEDGRIITNDEQINGEFISIYKDKAITKDGNVYSLAKKDYLGSTVDNIRLLSDSIPLFEFVYNEQIIKTYKTYSETTEQLIDDKLLYVKDNNLSVFSNNLEYKKDSIILDYYNDSSYQYLLGTDGVLYSLADEFNMPEDVKNAGIKNMTNNFSQGVDIVLLEYNDGSKICFNYKTGEILMKTEKTENISILDYLVTNLSVSTSLDVDDIVKENKESNKLIKKLERNIEELDLNTEDYKEVSKLNINEDTKYVSVYEPLTGKTEIFDESKLLGKSSYEYKDDDTITDETSIDNIIIKNNVLKKVYSTNSFNISNYLVNGIVMLVAILILIFITIFLFGKNISNKKEAN